MTDERLPQPGQTVRLDVPRDLRHLITNPMMRVHHVKGAVVELRAEEGSVQLSVGVPVVLTIGALRHRLEGTVTTNASPMVLTVQVTLPPDGREARRAPSQLDVDLDIIGDTDEPSLRGRTHDISEGGLRIGVSRSLPPGTRAFVSIAVPGQDPILGIGEVLECHVSVQSSDYEARIRFSSISPSHAKRLKALGARSRLTGD